MQELWLARRSSHETGEASLRDWLRLVCKAIQAVFCEQDWEHALQPKGSTMFALPCFEDVVHNLGMSFLLTYFGLFGMAILKPTRFLTNLTKLLPCWTIDRVALFCRLVFWEFCLILLYLKISI